jgi:hypothetical protein
MLGAATAARIAVEEVPALKALWGRGEGRKPQALLEVFALAMLSRWVARLEEHLRISKKMRHDARVQPGVVVLEMFQDRSEERLQRFLNLDEQFQHDNREGGRLLLELALRWAEACEALGQPNVTQSWPAEGFPFKDTAEFDRAAGFCEPRAHLDDCLQMSWILHAGLEGAVTWYNELVARALGGDFSRMPSWRTLRNM